MFQQPLIGNWMKTVKNVDGQVMNGTFIYSRMHCNDENRAAVRMHDLS